MKEKEIEDKIIGKYNLKDGKAYIFTEDRKIYEEDNNQNLKEMSNTEENIKKIKEINGLKER